MKRNCISCRQPTIIAREIDSHIIQLDAEPVDRIKDTVVLRGDLDDEPTAFWNVPFTGDSFWNLPAELPRYQRHTCVVSVGQGARNE